MRPALALAILLVASVPAGAQSGTMSWKDAASVPCKTYLTLPGTALYGSVQDVLVDHFGKFEDGGYFGSACNIGDYVGLTCRAHSSLSVGQAVTDLFSRLRSKRPLPKIKMCGA